LLTPKLAGLAAQRDSRLDARIAEETKSIVFETKIDSFAMKTIATLAMLFLPGSFISVSLVFSCVLVTEVDTAILSNLFLTLGYLRHGFFYYLGDEFYRQSKVVVLYYCNSTSHAACFRSLVLVGQSGQRERQSC
jgi:hypothetical protein